MKGKVLLKANLEVLPGMFCGKDIPLLGHCHMGIELCNVDGTMPQYFLDIADVDICLQ